MNPDLDSDVKSTLKSGKLGEDFYGFNHPNRFTGHFDDDGNYVGKQQNTYGGYGGFRGWQGYNGKNNYQGRGNYSYSYSGYGGYQNNYNEQYFNNFKAHDKDKEGEHPRQWWNYLKKDQFEGMVSQGKHDTSWKDKFESKYSKDEIDSMSQYQKDKAIKEILDDGQKKAGDSVAHQSHALSKDDKVVTDLMN